MILNLKETFELLENEYLYDENPWIKGVSIDSRTIKEGFIYFAIIGDNFDGHDFIKMAFEKGALAAVSSNKSLDLGANNPIIYVEDTRQALTDLARYYRKKFDIPIVGITGSNGKTTTKEYVKSVLQTKYNVSSTLGNLNNQTGVPLTIFSFTKATKAGVVEMGMNMRQEISQLSRLVEPDIGIITNIGSGHIGKLGSIQEIFLAKKEIIEGIKKDGFLILNDDDAFLSSIEEDIDENKNIRIIRVGIKSKRAHVMARDIVLNEDMTYSFKYEGFDIALALPGIHNVYNALNGLALVKILGLDLKKAIDAIENFEGYHMRSEISKIGDNLIINDAYNANYDSMKASIDILANYKQRKIAVLGDMLELGSFEKDYHKKVGAYLKEKNIDLLLAVGNNADFYREGALEAGMDQSKVLVFSNIEEAKQALHKLLIPFDVILIKGSRGAQMERILEGWKE